jgi:hypothetical protein
MNHLSRHHNGSSALHPQVMDDTPTLIAVPLAQVRPTGLDSQVHAEILRKYSVLRYVVLIYGIQQHRLKKLQCGEKGHYANHCRNRNVPGNRGGIERRRYNGDDY